MKRIIVFMSAYILSMGIAVAADIFNLTDTWNAGGTTFDAIKMVITDTASAADSRMLNITTSTGGVYQVNKDGTLTMTGTQYIAEQADASADVAGYGQIWVNTAVPNELWFTDDAGTDVQLGIPATAHTPEGTAVLSTGEVGAVKFLREDGDNTSSWQAVPAETFTSVVQDTTPVLGGELSNGGFDYVMTEVADHSSTPGAGFGYLWTQSTAPSTLMFTDDAGTDFDLTAGGGWNVEDTTNGNYGHGLTALDSITVGVGINNIAIGENAGTALTTGDDNVFIGDNAGSAVSTRVKNVGIGTNALSANNDILGQNVAIGYMALSTNAGGGQNVAIGAEAGENVSSNGNVFIGYQSGDAVSTGSDNTLIGSTTDVGATSDDNAFVGKGSGVGAGDDNVGLGVNAGSGAGSNNTSLGHSAANFLAGGTHNITIGSGVSPTSNTGIHQLTVGTAIVGYMGALSDVDYSGNNLTISGPSALAAATVNQDGGNLVLQAGQKATGGGVNGLTLVNDTVYGIMSTQGGVTSQDDIGTTPEILVAWNTDGIAHGSTPSHANDYITVDVAGIYEVTSGVSFSGTGSSLVTMEFYVYDDSGTSWGASGFKLVRKLGTGGDVGRGALSGLVTLDVSDRVAMYVATDGATDDVTVVEATFQIKRISN